MIRSHEYIYKCFLVPNSLNEVIARDRPVGNYGISRDAATIKEVMAYRREAEQYLGQDDHLYRIEWVS